MNCILLAKIIESALLDGAVIQINTNDFIILANNNARFGSFQDSVKISLFSFFESTVYEENTKFIRVSRAQIIEALLSLVGDKPIDPSFDSWAPPGLADFQEDFQRIQAEIKSETIQKAVPIVKVSSDRVPSLIDRLKMLRNLVNRTQKSAYVYGIFNKQWGVLGATPELLFQKTEDRIATMALAGSLPKSSGGAEVLIADPKENHENQLVVDFLESKLGSLGQLTISNIEVKELPTLWHLKRDIEVQLNRGISAEELIKLLHPTPALGISSARLTHHWMRELHHQTERKYFGAPLVVTIDGDSIAYVCIRNISWDNNGSVIHAGCGIVAESQVEKEWVELNAKINSVRELLGT